VDRVALHRAEVVDPGIAPWIGGSIFGEASKEARHEKGG
jgi:hypothetical protein